MSVVLAGVDHPSQLRGLSANALALLCDDLRRTLVETVSQTGGHLGSNLGVVELTVAIHRVFDSPGDTILWDTGHQAYVHKLLTGRRERFDTLRQKQGLSGYPSRAESHHDIIENSHASTALAYAQGFATARRLRRESGAVIAIVGDGALTGGVGYEALNNIGVRGERVIVIVNDNGRSYAPTVSRLFGRDGSARGFFEALGFDYQGPVDGHDLVTLEDALARAKTSLVPVVVHVHTIKGRGYEPALLDSEKRLHDTAPFDIATGRPLKSAERSWTTAFTEAMMAVGARRPDVVAISAAMIGSTGLLPFAAEYPDRCFDVGIAEQDAVTFAAGLAMAGLRPVVAIYSTFLNRAWDQILHDVALHGLPVIFCIDRAGITGEDGPSHHGVFDLALLSQVPGMLTLAPSSYDDIAVMLDAALARTDGPTAIRWPKGTASRSGARSRPITIRAERVAAGKDVCVLAVGPLVRAALDAAGLVAQEGFTATVWDVRCVSPLDRVMLEEARRHRLVVTCEDGFIEGGIGERITAALTEVNQNSRPTVRRIGLPNRFLPHQRRDDLLAHVGLDAAGIADQLLGMLLSE
jgi:1-deoxy-D-xylulose-5-phosphate synthase